MVSLLHRATIMSWCFSFIVFQIKLTVYTNSVNQLQFARLVFVRIIGLNIRLCIYKVTAWVRLNIVKMDDVHRVQTNNDSEMF